MASMCVAQRRFARIAPHSAALRGEAAAAGAAGRAAGGARAVLAYSCNEAVLVMHWRTSGGVGLRALGLCQLQRLAGCTRHDGQA